MPTALACARLAHVFSIAFCGLARAAAVADAIASALLSFVVADAFPGQSADAAGPAAVLALGRAVALDAFPRAARTFARPRVGR